MAAPVVTQRVLVGVAATLTAQLLDQHGEPVTAGGAVTVDVTAADGTVIASGAATTNDAGNPPTYSYALPAQAALNLLTVTWKDGGTARLTTVVEIVGGYYFTIAEARASDSSLLQSKYDDAKVLDVRREVEDECEWITRGAWVPRYRRLLLDGNDSSVLPLGVRFIRTVRSVRLIGTDGVTYTTLTAAQLAAIEITDGGALVRRDLGVWYSRDLIAVELEHGASRPPSDLKRAALTRLRYRLNIEKSGIPDRATNFVPAEGGNFTIATPGRAGFDTGIPEVDAVYQRYRRSRKLMSVRIA